MADNAIIIKAIDTAVGVLMLGSIEDRLCMCDWQNGRYRTTVDKRLIRLTGRNFRVGTSDVIELAHHELTEYFAGKRREFGIPYVLYGTDFQIRTWRAIASINYGNVATYSHLAHLIGNPEAVRAVAGACAANRMAIIVPCHRIVAHDGLGGYDGGLEVKKYLLWLEGIL